MTAQCLKNMSVAQIILAEASRVMFRDGLPQLIACRGWTFVSSHEISPRKIVR